MMIDELHTLMNFFPVTSNQQTVATLLDYVEKRLSRRGLQTERIVHQGVHSLYASTRRQKHTRVMLQGHIDVVPGGEAFRQDGDRIYGRGCYDMLFATASFLRLIDNLENPASFDISLLLTGDEEVGGHNGTRAVLDVQQYTCDVCILPDAGEGLGTMSVAAKGLYQPYLKVCGASHHGSRPWEGDGAANKLVALLDEFVKIFDTSDRNNSTLTISQLQAGNEALNQGPAEAFAGVDIRFADTEEFERIQGELSALLKQYDAEVLSEEYSRSYAINTDLPIVQRFIEIYSEAVSDQIKFIKSHGSSDARYFDDKGIPVIMFRPHGGNAHGDGEWLSLASWEKFHQILERYVLETSRV